MSASDNPSPGHHLGTKIIDQIKAMQRSPALQWLLALTDALNGAAYETLVTGTPMPITDVAAPNRLFQPLIEREAVLRGKRSHNAIAVSLWSPSMRPEISAAREVIVAGTSNALFGYDVGSLGRIKNAEATHQEISPTHYMISTWLSRFVSNQFLPQFRCLDHAFIERTIEPQPNVSPLGAHFGSLVGEIWALAGWSLNQQLNCCPPAVLLLSSREQTSPFSNSARKPCAPESCCDQFVRSGSLFSCFRSLAAIAPKAVSVLSTKESSSILIKGRYDV
jgi:hypothetical protein